jgi:membrane-associated protease RseP (regulator of RpoE activity)
LHFNLARFHVRIHPLFWVVTLLLQIYHPPVVVALWTVVVVFSLIVHEMGHALAFRWYGRDSHIVLYSFGGLTIPEGAFTRPQTARSRILISLAGPAAGFLFALLLELGLYVGGYYVGFHSMLFSWDFLGRPIEDPRMQMLIGMLLQVNIFWGIMNLLPIFPLDGGQVFREVLQMANPQEGFEQALKLSIVTAAAMAALSFMRFDDFYLALMFGYLAYMNYGLLQAYGGRRG